MNVTIAVEYALRFPGSFIRYYSPFQKDLRDFLIPMVREIVSNASPDEAPLFKSLEGAYYFPNGSIIRLAGLNSQQGEKSRGKNSSLLFIDEAGQVDDLRRIWEDVLLPTGLTEGATTILSSTPPLSPDHDFRRFYEECELAGNSVKFTIDDNTFLSPEKKELYIRELGGRQSTACRRELYVEFVTEEDRSLVPEWKQKEFCRAVIPGEFHRFWHRYEAMDIGHRDFTAILFAFYDFQHARLHIEAEVVLKGAQATTRNIRDSILETERQLWPKSPVYKRVADNNNPILLQDLASFSRFASEEGIGFVPTTKDSLEAMVNEVRMWVKAGRVWVDPSCKQLLGCLQYGIWDKNRKDFARSNVYGHYDAFAALMYLIRNVSVHSNPVPPNYGILREDTYLIKKDNKNGSAAAELAKLFPAGTQRRM